MKNNQPNAQLHYVNSGQGLLYAAEGPITLWADLSAQLPTLLTGQLVGVATTGASCITVEAQNVFHAWDTATGQELPLNTLTAADYPFHRRVHLRERPDAGKACLEVLDALGEYPPQVVNMGQRAGGYLEAWAMLPGRCLAAVMFGVDGRDDTRGRLYDLATGPVAGSFEAEWDNPTLWVAPDAQYFVSTGTGGAWWYRLPPDITKNFAYVMGFELKEGNCAQIALHPQHPLRFAVAARRLGQPDQIRIIERPADVREKVVLQKWAAPGAVVALAFDAQGHELAGCLENGAVVRWEAATGKVLGVMGQLPAKKKGGKTLVMKQWQLARHRPWLRFDPTGTWLMHEHKNTVHVWELRTGQRCHSCPGNFIGWAQDGTTFLTRRVGAEDEDAAREYAPGEDVLCEAWDTATGAALPLDNIPVEHYSPAQRLVLTGRDHPPTVYAWDALGAAKGYTVAAPNRAAYLENWSIAPDGATLALLSIEADEVAYVTLHGRTGRSKQGHYTRIAYSEQVHFGNGGWLAVCHRDWKFYRPPSEEPLGTFPEKGDALAFHPACTPKAAWGAAAHNAYRQPQVHFFAVNVATSTATTPVAFCERMALPKPVTYLAFHPDGVRLACLLADDTVEVWDVVRGERLLTLPQGNAP